MAIPKANPNQGFFETYFPTFSGISSLVRQRVSPATQRVANVLKSSPFSSGVPGTGKGSATRGGRPAPAGTPYQNEENTTYKGASATATPALSTFQRGIDRVGRLDGIQSDWNLFSIDPRMSEAVEMLAIDALSGGFALQISGKEGTGAREVKRAKNEIEQMFKRCRLTKLDGSCNVERLREWLRAAPLEGDLFVQRVWADKYIVGAEYMPAGTMERLSNDADQFVDPLHAFAQIDGATNIAGNTWSLFEMGHYRWKRIGGDRYGTGYYKQARQKGRQLRLEEEAQTIRRISNSARIETYAIGRPEDDYEETAIESFKKDNGMDGPNAKRSTDPYEQNTRRLFSGNVKADVLPSDPNIHEIDDLKWSATNFILGLHAPLQLKGYALDQLARDQLQMLLQQWLKDCEYAEGFIHDVLLDLIEFQLTALSLNPAAFNISLTRTRKAGDSFADTVNLIVKGLSAALGVGHSAIPAPIFTKEQCGEMLKPFLSMNDIPQWIDALEKMAKANGLDPASVHERNAQMQGADGGSQFVGAQNGAANSKNKAGGATTGYSKKHRKTGGKASGEGYQRAQ